MSFSERDFDLPPTSLSSATLSSHESINASHPHSTFDDSSTAAAGTLFGSGSRSGSDSGPDSKERSSLHPSSDALSVVTTPPSVPVSQGSRDALSTEAGTDRSPTSLDDQTFERVLDHAIRGEKYAVAQMDELSQMAEKSQDETLTYQSECWGAYRDIEDLRATYLRSVPRKNDI